MNQSSISITNLFKSYSKKQVLIDLSCQFTQGKIIGLAGPNACGKTTLIKSILGLVNTNGGSITINGQAIDSAGQYRKKIGYMPQNADFPFHLTPEELFQMLMGVRGEKSQSIDRLIEMFQLTAHIKKKFGILSGGTKQKVAAVIAFMFDPPILILDEPTVGLDPVSANALKLLMQCESKKGKTIILVSHIMSEVEQLVDEVVFLLDGKIVFSGTKNQLQYLSQKTSVEEGIIYLLTVPNKMVVS